MGIPIISDLLDPLKDLISEVIVDPDKKREMQFRIRELEDKANQRLHEQLMAQVEVNKTEASHRSVFIAGWRPMVGWMGAAGLGFQCIVFPLLRMFGLPDPGLDTELLILTMTSILGVGAMRSYDKQRGTSNDAPLGRPAAAPTPPPAEVPPGFSPAALPEETPWNR